MRTSNVACYAAVKSVLRRPAWQRRLQSHEYNRQFTGSMCTDQHWHHSCISFHLLTTAPPKAAVKPLLLSKLRPFILLLPLFT